MNRGGQTLGAFVVLILLLELLPAACFASAQEPDLGDLSLEELLDVPVTTASREARTFREAPAALYVVTETMIRERGYNYLYDALRDAPGFDILWMGGLYGPILMQHGLDTPENNKLVLMIDGIPDNNLSAGTAQVYMQYSLHNVQRIEILYGPASALYGANAMTGLINIITRRGSDLRGVEVQTGAIAWDSGFRRTGATGAVAAGDRWGPDGQQIEVSGAFHLVNTDGTDLRLKEGEARTDNPGNPAAANYFFSPIYIGSAERHTFLAQGRAFLEKYGLTLGGHVWQHRGGQGTFGHEAYFLNGFQNKPDTWNYRNSTVFVEHNLGLRSSLSNKLLFVYRDTRILDDSYDAIFSVPGSGPDGPGKPGDAGSRYYRPDHSIRFEDSLHWNLPGGSALTAGISTELQKVSDYHLSLGHSFDQQLLMDPGVKPEIDETRQYDYDDFSFYFEHYWHISGEFALTTGLRADLFRLQGERTPYFFGTRDYDSAGNCLPNAPDCRTPGEAAAAGAVEVSGVYYLYEPYRKNRSTFNPRIGAVYTPPGKPVTFKALYGEGFRVPTVRELFSVTGSRYSNPELGSEKVHTAEIGAVYEIRGHGFIELDAFYTNANEIIQLSPGTVKRPGRETNMSQFQNTGHARIYGFDLQAQVKASPILELFGSYSFQVPHYDDTAPSNLSHDAAIVSANDTSDLIPRQARHKGTLGAVLRLWNRRLVLSPRVNVVGSRRGVATSTIREVDSYASLNLSARINNAGIRGLWVEFTGYNLTNSDILDPGFRTATPDDDFPAVHPQPGFHFFLNAGYRFDF